MKKHSKKNTLRVRIDDHELRKLECHASKHGHSISHVIREYIRRLPVPKEEGEVRLLEV